MASVVPRDITVAINTRNRAASLAATLASLACCTLPAERTAELVVVDNGSSDRTREVVEGFRWPGVEVHYLFVAEPGVARAKNAAIRHSTGRVVLFLDDDVRVPVEWLDAMSRPILDGEVDAIGGGIRIPPDRKPAGTTPMHEEWFASTEHWEPTRPPALVGANMAIGRHVFERVACFDEALQHGEDTLLSNQIPRAGLRLVNRLDIAVDHLLQPGRFTRAGIREQAGRRARWHAWEVHHWEGGDPSLPRLRWLAARCRLAWYRLHHPAGGELPEYREMQLMQDAAFWPAFLRVRHEPRRFPST